MTFDDFVELPDLGRVPVTEQRRPGGVIAYRVSAAELFGTVVFKPDVLDQQLVPDRVIVQLGDGEHVLATHVTNLLVVRGITLVGGGDAIDLDTTSWPLRLRLTPLKAADRATAGGAAAVRRAVALCQLLASRYRSLDRLALMRAAAQHTAGPRLKRWVHQQILIPPQMHSGTGEELAAAYRFAEALQQWSPLPLLPTPPACACAGALPCVSPDTYVTADDEGDWLTCPTCDQKTVMVTPGTSVGALLGDHAAHTCRPDLP
ncbi:hypothetical protein F8271_09980 [Micromonospora sp. ALFpr18c]|uniref:hypothetical protein n=1 Tax=Micromonospora sp. ALFpr18c TaxID=1458665 RepID=UPI00124B5925|nr:hypothetical protein [Micromonospora sp. ALFpr18c]KAB1943414.1 hypothetical protein F8271_09980 [Micromonospora sp. ALFpr18c]